MKAYAVTETYENTGGIVFASSAVVARRRGADEFADGEFGHVSCRRAPWADHLAEKGEPVPASLLIDNGWHFDCGNCGATIDIDWLDENDLPVEGVIGHQHSLVFCSEVCECQFKLDRAIARDHQRRAIEGLKAFVRKRFRGVTFRADDAWAPHAYAAPWSGTGVWQVEQVVVAFDFPGMKIGAAQCRFDRRHDANEKLIGPIRPYFTCCAGDREVFEAWAASPASREARA